MMTPDEILRQADEQIAARKKQESAPQAAMQASGVKQEPRYLSETDMGFEAPARGLKGWGQDIAATAVKGAIAVPELAVGLMDIPTGGRVGKFLENKDGAFGFRPKEAKEAVNEWHSDATKEAQQKFQQADGLVDKFGVALQNPSLIATAVGESLPSMFAGGLVGRGIQGARGLMAAREASKAGLGSAAATKAAEQAMAKGTRLASAAGEGAVMAGAQASAIRQETEDGLLTPGQAGLSLATGVSGGAFGYGGSKLANRFGVGDVDTMMVQGMRGMNKEFADAAATAATNPVLAVAKAKSLPRKVIEGAIIEGVFEELPQSVMETILQNLALNKPWAEGLNDAIVLGTLAGLTMGASASGYKGLVTPRGAAGGGAADQQPSADASTPPADNWTTSPGAAPINGAQPGTGVDSLANHPLSQAADFDTSPGAAPVHDNALPFEREFDTGNLTASPVDGPLGAPAPAAREFGTGSNLTLLPSEQMGLRTGPDAGPLENAAALSVDTGATAQMQGAAGIVTNDLQSEPQAANAIPVVNFDEVTDPYERAMLQRLYDDHYADGDLESVISANAELDTSFDFGANVNQLLANAGATPQEIEDAQRGQASAQAADRPGQAQENDRGDFDAELSVAKNEGDGSGRPAGAEQGEASQQPLDQQAAAPGSQAEGANVATLAQLNRKKLAEMSDDELQQLSSMLPADHNRQQKIQQAIQTRATQAQAAINEGANHEYSPDQAQQAVAQPAQAGAAQAGQQTTPVAASTNAAPNAVEGHAQTAPEFTTIQTIYGDSVTVRTSDLNSDKTRLRQYTRDGKSKAVPAIHRDNLDATGEKGAALAKKEAASNPLFNTIMDRSGAPFGSRAAAQREVDWLGLSGTHDVVPAGNGFVGKAKTETMQEQQQTAQKEQSATETVAPTAGQQTNSQRNASESAAGQAQAATNNLPANLQEGIAASQEKSKQEQPPPRTQQAVAQPTQAGAAQAAQPAGQITPNAAPNAGVEQAQAAPGSKYPPTDVRIGDKVVVDGEIYTVTAPIKQGRKSVGIVADRDSDTNPLAGVKQVLLKGDEAIAARLAALGQQPAQAAPDQRAKRLDEAGAQWTRMPAAERSALVGRLDGVKPVLAKNMPKAQWESLNSDIQRKIANAMGTTPALDSKANQPPTQSQQAQAETEKDSKASSEGENRARASGEGAAMQGYAMSPPSNIRKRSEREAWEEGWLSGERKRAIALEGLEAVTVGDRVARPTLNSKNSVVWREDRSGKDYDTAAEARAGMERSEAALRDLDDVKPSSDRAEKITKESGKLANAMGTTPAQDSGANKPENQFQSEPEWWTGRSEDERRLLISVTNRLSGNAFANATTEWDSLSSEQKAFLVKEYDDYVSGGASVGPKAIAKVVVSNGGKSSTPKPNQPQAQPQQAQAATENVAQQSPQDFIPAPDGGLDYGEITPDMGRAMRRQAGKIRLQHGVQNADGTGWGLVHIEARHGKEIRSAGFESVEQFLADAFRNVDEVWRPGSTSQLIAVQSGRTGKIAFVQLEADRQGGKDFYRINSAFPANEKYVARKERKEGWKPLWSRYPVPADASGASGFVGQSPEAGETTPTVSGQSGATSVPPTAAAAQPRPKGWEKNYGPTKIVAESLGISLRNSNGKMKKRPELVAEIKAMDAANPSAKNEARQPLTPDSAQNTRFGDVVVDGQGQEYVVAGQRHKWLEVAPFVDGRPQISATTTLKFHLEPETAASYEGERRSDPLYTTGRNYFDELKAKEASVQSENTPEAQAESKAPTEPNPLEHTPKQYADAWLRWSAETNSLPLAEVREMQGDEAGLKAIEQRWVDAVLQEAKSGQPLPAKTLDKLLEVRPNAKLPESAIPDGYQRPEARKAEKEEAAARKAKPAAQSPIERAKAVGIKGLRADMSDETLRQRVKSYLAGERAARLIAAGKQQADLPQYQGVSEKDARTLGALVESHPYSVNTSGEQWVFDARGVTTADALVQGGLLKPDNGNYKHELTPVGKEIARKALRSPIGDASIGDMLTELEESKPKTGNGAMFSRSQSAKQDRGAGTIDQTETEAFKRWFGNSKVVDADGKPLVVYHGTEADFSEFSREYIGSANTQTPIGSGFFFAKDPAVASRYAERSSANVMPVYVSVQNPAPTLEAMTATGSEYDGFINSKIVVARSPAQIKSATGNNGNFDPANPDTRYSRMDDNAATEGVSNEQRQTPNGIPAGLPATSDPDSQYLERRINNWLQTSGWRADRLSAVSLPIELRTALDRFTDATGTRVVLFRNLTPEIEDFNGVNFRDGRVFINETSQHPATLTAAHEWVHNFKRTNPKLYQQLEDEVREQGRIPQWHQRNIKEEGMDRGIDHAIEELTAAAVSDAMTDPAFLEQLALRNQGVFRRVAQAFLDFLDTLTSGWRDQGSNAYLRDVQAFRNKLADVLDRLPTIGQDAANFAANPARRPGTAQDKAVMQAIADGKSARDVLRLVANGSKDPFLRQVARLLLKAGITPNIQFGHIGKTKKGDPIHGQYRGNSDTIAIAGSAEYAAERIFMHEAMHAATMRALAKPGLARLQLQKLLEHVRKNGGAAGFYGLKNVDEFVAEVFTNPDFQAALRKMKAPSESSGIKTAWDGFVRILRSILGLKNDPNNVLSQALQLGVAAMREDMGLRKRADRASLRLRGDVVAAAGVTPLQLRVQTVEWAKQRWSEGGGGQAEVVRNTDPRFGKDVRIAWQGVKHAIAGANQPELRLIPHVAKIVQSARYLRSEDDRANRAHIKQAHFFEANVVLDGERLLVGMVVHEKADGQMFYDQFIVSKARDQKDAPPHGTSGNGMPGISDRSVLQPSSGGGSIVGQGMDSGQDGVANFGTDNFAALKASALEQISQSLSHPGKVSLWDRSVGTMRNLAERVPQFKPVFEAAQRFIDDVSMLANDAADFAPRLMPRVDSIGDIIGKNRKKPITAADNKAVAKPLFEGTLMWARDLDGTPVTTEALNAKYRNTSADEKAQVMLRTGKLDDRVLKMWKGMPIESYEKAVASKFDSTILKPGVVWSQKELKDIFKLGDKQVSLYQEARAAIDRSLDMTARTDMLRLLGDEFAGMRAMVLEQDSLKDAFDLVVDTLQEEARANPDMADRLMGINNSVVNRYETATELMEKGYAPLSRFGKYTVDVVDANGERQYFGMFESMREANQMAMKMRDVFKGAAVTQGTMSEQAFKLFQGITPESLEMFGSMLGLKGEGSEAQDKAFQAYLQLAKNNHSALKRLIHRKGIDGYSEDVGRVLASFVYSNARLGSQGLNAGTMETAIEGIPKEMGELRDVAMGLRNYIQDPQEEGQAVRGMLFAQYLGGSVASAFVNMTQPFQITMPWLSQYGGMGQAAKQMARALKDMGTKGFKYEADLAKALQSAEDDGVVSPQEIHQLMAQARGTGSLRTGDGTKLGDARATAANNWERVKVAWGQPFALAEQFNRRSTFIASYRIAKAQGMADPAEFARRAVLETQFLYSKANKMRWGRGAIGGTLMTFKTYSVSYLELMHRMWNQGEAGSPERAAGRRAVGWAVAMLLLMGGAGGLPFMEDAEDLIDGTAQLMGYNLSTKQARKEFLSNVFGKEFAEFMEQGITGLPGMPVDVGGRLGLQNLVPGTGLALEKRDRMRDLLEIAGPAGDLVDRFFTGARKALTGDVAGAALEMSPTAVRNAAKGIDMATSGIYKDTKGYKVMDVTLGEAISKFAGFQPKSVAEDGEASGFKQRTKSFYIQTSADIKAQWADAVFRKDDAALERVRERLAAWNRNNPDLPITVKIPDIMKRVREMGKDREQRINDTAPKALRQQFREMSLEASR